MRRVATSVRLDNKMLMNREEKIKLAIESGFTYNKETGEVLSRFGKKPIIKNGYYHIRLNKNCVRYYLLAHHFAWYMCYNECAKGQIDHINGIRNDNRICNLRDVSQQINTWNRVKAKGYTWNKKCGKWQAKIVKDYKNIYLGLYDSEKEAREAYLDAKKKYHKWN